LGCNCKNKVKEEPKPAVIKKADDTIEFIMEAPPYSREEVIRVKDYLLSFNKTETERLNMIEFNYKYFGEIMEGYCDQVCLDRVKRRTDRAIELLNDYEQIKIQNI
jgi:hypothetical protein